MTSDFSTEMLQGRTQWSNAFEILRETNFQLRIIYSAKLLSRISTVKIVKILVILPPCILFQEATGEYNQLK